MVPFHPLRHEARVRAARALASVATFCLLGVVLLGGSAGGPLANAEAQAPPPEAAPPIEEPLPPPVEEPAPPPVESLRPRRLRPRRLRPRRLRPRRLRPRRLRPRRLRPRRLRPRRLRPRRPRPRRPRSTSPRPTSPRSTSPRSRSRGPVAAARTFPATRSSPMRRRLPATPTRPTLALLLPAMTTSAGPASIPARPRRAAPASPAPMSPIPLLRALERRTVGRPPTPRPRRLTGPPHFLPRASTPGSRSFPARPARAPRSGRVAATPPATATPLPPTPASASGLRAAPAVEPRSAPPPTRRH